MIHGFFDSMIITNGRRSCKASELYTKKDPFIHRPQSEHDLSREEREAQRRENEERGE